ncbi:D-glucuronyl C5-epimerase family protein [Pseudidiomarina halophila]|nr:D-glucuronyl C5-epimerase family protein [Pseudidiomarina halophila]
MKIKWIYTILISFSLFGCQSGDDDRQDKVTQLKIIAPDIIEEGSRVLVKVEDAPQGITLDVGGAFRLDDSDAHVEFVAPNVVSDDEMLITVNLQDGESVTRSLLVKNLEPPIFYSLPRSYPLESGRIEKHANAPRDANGVPLFVYGDEQVYFHVYISKIAQVYYQYIRANNLPGAETQEFLAMADWLRDNCVYTAYGFCSWQATFDIPAYSLPDNWTSAMAQGQAITVLLSAYALTQDETYFNTMSDALSAFNYPVEEKGVFADFEGHRFYQEYGSEDRPANVLNGFLFAMAGLYDVWDLSGSETAHQAFEQGLESLKNVISLYDLGFTTRYDYSHLNQIASTKGGGNGDLYHEIHISQLAWLYTVTRESWVLDYLKKFLSYDTGGLTAFGMLAGPSLKITDVQVSSSVSAETHGPNYLTDSNWTWRRYWSSVQTPTTVKLTLNNGSTGSLDINEIRLTSLRENTLPSSISVFECDGVQRKILMENLIDAETTTTFHYDVNGYQSSTYVYKTELKLSDCPEIIGLPSFH